MKAVPEGWVEIEVCGDLLTPFQNGKKVMLLDRQSRKTVVALLQDLPSDPEGRFTVQVKETDASVLLQRESWEIVPYLTTLTLAPVRKGEAHEIRY